MTDDPLDAHDLLQPRAACPPPVPDTTVRGDVVGATRTLPAAVARVEGDVALTPATDVHTLSRLVSISGDLTVRGASGDDLGGGTAALPCLERVGGSLLVVGRGDLPWLPRLTQIDGDLTVVDADDARDLSALGALTTVGGDAVFEGMRSLRTPAGLAALRRVGGDLVVEDAPSLIDLALPRLQDVGGVLRVEDAASVRDLHGLEALRGLGGVALVDLPSLSRLTGASGIDTLGSLTLEALGRLVDLDDLAGLERVDGVVRVADNPALVDVSGLEHLAGVTALQVQDNPTICAPQLRPLTQVFGWTSDNRLGSTCSAPAAVASFRLVPTRFEVLAAVGQQQVAVVEVRLPFGGQLDRVRWSVVDGDADDLLLERLDPVATTHQRLSIVPLASGDYRLAMEALDDTGRRADPVEITVSVP